MPVPPLRRIVISFTYNRVTLVARAASPPEVRFTSAGQRIATLRLATDRPARAGATPTTDWHRVVCWDRLAEIAVEHVGKGRLVFVEGAVTYRDWQDQQGQKHALTEIYARELIVLDRPSGVPQAPGHHASVETQPDAAEDLSA